MTPLVTLYLSALTVLSQSGPAPKTIQFPDVPAWHWAANAVFQLKEEGILVGYPGGDLGGRTRPKARVDRRVLEKTMKRVFGLERGHHDIVRRRDLSRYEAAVLVNAAVHGWANQRARGERANFAAYVETGPLLISAALDYERELTSLGIDFPAFMKELRSLIDASKR